MKTIAILSSAMLFVVSGPLSNASAQTYTYQLLPGATITPTEGAVPTGPSEALTGSFTLTSDPADSNATTYAFNLTALSLASSGFTFSLVTPSPVNDTQTNGDAFFNANTTVTGGTTGSYTLSNINAGSFTGPGSAPTELLFPSLGLAPSTGGLYVAHISFDAVLTPEPSSAALSLMALATMALLVAARCGLKQPK